MTTDRELHVVYIYVRHTSSNLYVSGAGHVATNILVNLIEVFYYNFIM